MQFSYLSLLLVRTLFYFFEMLYNGKKAELENVEGSKIFSIVSEVLNTVEIAKRLQRDHRNLKTLIQEAKKSEAKKMR